MILEFKITMFAIFSSPFVIIIFFLKDFDSLYAALAMTTNADLDNHR